MTTEPTALAFNAVTQAAAEQRRFLSLTDRQRIADAVLAAVSPMIEERAAEKERAKVVEAIRSMPHFLDDGGWEALAKKAEAAGYEPAMVYAVRDADNFASDTVVAAYQYGYRQAAAIARTHAHPKEITQQKPAMGDDAREEAAAEMGLCQCRDDYQCEHNSQAVEIDE